MDTHTCTQTQDPTLGLRNHAYFLDKHTNKHIITETHTHTDTHTHTHTERNICNLLSRRFRSVARLNPDVHTPRMRGSEL